MRRLSLPATPVLLFLAACGSTPEGRNPGECADGADNDGNGAFDCDDAGCAESPDCAGGGETGSEENAAPSGAAIAIEPASPGDDDDLTCTVVTEATDPNGDVVTYRFAWARNGADAGVDAATVGAALTSGGDTWTCTVTPNDGALDGAAATASVTIAQGNRAPSAPGVSITPASPTDDDVLTCVIDTESVDPDGDAVTYAYAWSVDGADAGVTAASVNATRTGAGETWTCSVTANDGQVSGAAGTASVVVGEVALGSDRTHPGASCADVLDTGASVGDGLYWLTIESSSMQVYCDMTTDGGGWTLVRRNLDPAWNDNPNDDLVGDTTYGSVRGMDPEGTDAFGIAFGGLAFSEFRFASGDGDRWLKVTRDQVYGGWVSTVGSCGEAATIEASHLRSTSYSIDWCKRHGAEEDPWISATDHNSAIGGGMYADTDDHSMLYGEATGQSYVWGYFVTYRNGANVWVR